MSGPLHMHCAIVKSVRFSRLAGPSIRLQKLRAQFPLQALVLMPVACCSLFLLLAACTTGAQVQGPVLSGTSMSHGDKTHFQMNFKRRI